MHRRPPTPVVSVVAAAQRPHPQALLPPHHAVWPEAVGAQAQALGGDGAVARLEEALVLPVVPARALWVVGHRGWSWARQRGVVLEVAHVVAPGGPLGAGPGVAWVPARAS